MKLTCVECKNEVNLASYPNLAVGHILECNHCGIILLVKKIDGEGEVETEIVDEGK
ncbi:MAG: hypothetical protein Q8P52_02740 [bacterium]|nr:hypothetical protein [bacterium]